MRRRVGRIVLIIISVCCAMIALFFLYILFFPANILPTKSSPHTLSIVRYSGYSYSNKPVITIKSYENDLHICDYILEIETGVFIQEPQSYELPETGSRTVDIQVELGDEMNSSFTLTYNDAADLYQKGLLVYLAKYDELYVYFVSGKETTCYSRATDAEEWTNVAEFPSPKAIPREENPGFVSIYSGWKENEWVVKEISN